MICPLCGVRKAKRQCPARGDSICPVCCGTKRLVQIQCPETCAYLSAARANPAAVVRRQLEADLTALQPTIDGLTERQHQLFFLFQSVVARHRPDGLARLLDADVADAAGTVAATLETADKGVIYEHTAQSPVAKKLAAELSAVLAQIREKGAVVSGREAAATLRAIEQGARSTRGASGDDSAYLSLISRLLQVNRSSDAAAAPSQSPSIILP